MKKTSLFLIVFIVLSSCKKKSNEVIDNSKEVLVEIIATYPENLSKVFLAHGGIDAWKAMKTLAFTMEKPEGIEVITTNLNSREALIESPSYSIGFDGEKPWLLNKSEAEYKGYDPKFGYNLMFYFYAMPFILSDDGIKYEDAEPLVFNGVTYPGIQITYNAGVGETPEDRYVLYYNPTTYQMEWLGYTVSFVPNIDKKELHFRKYSEWQNINGLLLPKTIVSYGFNNDKPTEAKGSTHFINVILNNEDSNSKMFKKPEKAEFVE